MKINFGGEWRQSAVQWVHRGDGSSLSLNYNRDGLDKEWNGFGVALNDWEVLDMSQVFSASALTFNCMDNGLR